MPLKVQEGLRLTLSHAAYEGMRAVIRYDGPIAAPIEEGQTLGAAVFILPSGEEVERLLVAGASGTGSGGDGAGSERRCATSSSGRRRFYRAHRRGRKGPVRAQEPAAADDGAPHRL